MYTRQDRRRNKKKKQEKEKNKKFTHIHAHGRFMPSICICTHMCVHVCTRPRMCAVLCSFMKWTMRAASNQMSNRTFWLEIHSRGCAVLSVQWMHLRYKTNVCGYSHSYMWCAINAILCQEKLCLKSQLTTEKWKKYKCNDFDCNWIYIFFYFPHQFSQLIILWYWIWMVGIQS